MNDIIKLVYNDKYGGFDLSNEALKEYNIRTNKNVIYTDSIDRDDLVLIDLVEKMGKNVNNAYSKLKIIEFPKKFKDFLIWSEYDGKEYVTIDYDKYLIHMIQKAREKKLSSDEKMALIDELFLEYESNSKKKK